MKSFLHMMLCALLSSLCLSIPALAADTDLTALPERQGDFYVMVNGEFVTYVDAVPQARDNRSFLPMAATFSQLGFAQENMTWTPDGIITATKDNLTITLTLGRKEIVLTQAGISHTVPTDVAPYVDPATWRTYVPFGLVADALGYNVGWDGDTGTVIIDDVDTILASNAASYTLMDRYLEDFHSSTPQKFIGTADLWGYAAPKDHSEQFLQFALKGECEMLTDNDTEAQFLADLTSRAIYLVDGNDLFKRAAKLDHSLLTFPRTIDVDMRCDLENGTFRFLSEALRRPQDPPAPANNWLLLDAAGLLDRSDCPDTKYAALRKIMSIPDAAPTFEESISLLLKSTKPNSIHYTSRDMLEEVNRLYADDAFQKSGSMYISKAKTSDDSSIAFTLFRNGAIINGYTLSVDTEDAHAFISMREQNMELGLSLTLDTKLYDEEDKLNRSSNLYISFSMTGEYRSCTQLPDAQPPADTATTSLKTLISEELNAAGITIPAFQSEK